MLLKNLILEAEKHFREEHQPDILKSREVSFSYNPEICHICLKRKAINPAWWSNASIMTNSSKSGMAI